MSNSCPPATHKVGGDDEDEGGEGAAGGQGASAGEQQANAADKGGDATGAAAADDGTKGGAEAKAAVGTEGSEAAAEGTKGSEAAADGTEGSRDAAALGSAAAAVGRCDASTVSKFVQRHASAKQALLKYLAGFGNGGTHELGKAPPCRSYRSLLVLDEFMDVADKLKACNSKEELANLAAAEKVFKNAYTDLMAMARAAPTRLRGAIKSAQQKQEKGSVGDKQAGSQCLSLGGGMFPSLCADNLSSWHLVEPESARAN